MMPGIEISQVREVTVWTTLLVKTVCLAYSRFSEMAET